VSVCVIACLSEYDRYMVNHLSSPQRKHLSHVQAPFEIAKISHFVQLYMHVFLILTPPGFFPSS
jgi:hypothetical protein